MTEREQCERFPPGARKWVDNVEVEWQPTCIDPPGETGMDPCWPCFEYLREQLTAAEAKAAELESHMSWASGHDRQGLDHLDEMMKASTERDAAEASEMVLERRLSTAKSALERIAKDEHDFYHDSEYAKGLQPEGKHHPECTPCIARAALKEME